MPDKLYIALVAFLGATVCLGFSDGALNATEIEQGFVFIDGEYLPGPYSVQDVPGGATINGRNITLVVAPQAPSGTPSMQTNRGGWRGTQFVSQGEPQFERPSRPEGLPPGQYWSRGDRRPQFDERRPQFDPRRTPGGGNYGPERRERIAPLAQIDARRVANCLETDGVVVAFTGQIAVLIDHSQVIGFLRVLTGNQNISELEPLLKNRPVAERDQWHKWLTDYQAPEPLLSRVNLRINNHEQLLAENLADVAATRRLHSLAYPLTVLGMLLGVFALGHLLSSPPKGSPRLPNSPRNAKFCRAACISLGLIVVLSALDLAWTVLASQAGQMRELNPLGSSMIEDPLLLTLFKGSATFGSCGLLLVLRRHQRAQWAAWWMCLVLTVLTFRWLVLNSMFVV